MVLPFPTPGPMPHSCYCIIIYFVWVLALSASSCALVVPFSPGPWYQTWLLGSSPPCGSLTLSVSGSGPCWPFRSSWALALILGQLRSPGSPALTVPSCGPSWASGSSWALAPFSGQLRPPGSMIWYAPWSWFMAVAPLGPWPCFWPLGVTQYPSPSSPWL